jgi:PIN domain nuclease of toxin-antitoxin system
MHVIDFAQAEAHLGGRRNRTAPIEIADVAHVATPPFHHCDSFDRMLAAQALERGFTIVSVDEALDQYGIMRP